MIKKKEARSWIKQLLTTLFLLVLIASVAWPLSRRWLKGNEVNREIAGLEAEITDLNKRNSDLRRLIDYLESDQFVDEQARRNLNLKKPGEEVVVIDDGSEAAVRPEQEEIYRLASELPKEKKPANPVKWFEYFFN